MKSKPSTPLTDAREIFQRLPESLHAFVCPFGSGFPGWLTLARVRDRAKVAKRLSEALGGSLRVRYSPMSYHLTDDGQPDESSQGHLYDVSPCVDSELLYGDLDDRSLLPGDLEQQLAGLLRGWSDRLRELADGLAAKGAKR